MSADQQADSDNGIGGGEILSPSSEAVYTAPGLYLVQLVHPKRLCQFLICSRGNYNELAKIYRDVPGHWGSSEKDLIESQLFSEPSWEIRRIGVGQVPEGVVY